jgi:hypothetical protein
MAICESARLIGCENDILRGRAGTLGSSGLDQVLVALHLPLLLLELLAETLSASKHSD